jgi:two-component system sensor histidine kinase BaeS
MGGLPCDFRKGDALACLQTVAQRFELQAKRSGLQLTYPNLPCEPLQAQWDFGRMEQVLSNLLTNSLRYTQAPGRVVLDWQQQGPFLVLTVDDTAPGVSSADLPLLFEPLFRADRSRQRSPSPAFNDSVVGSHGSGLGLSIVQTMVQAHGGTVEATASALGGLCICVRVPLVASPGVAKSP